MKRLSEKLTAYVINAGVVSEELYAVYQYGFQIGLEMLCCFAFCLGIAIYLHMISQFIVFTGIFMLLRTYAGGIHLNSFGACFFCSVAVQTAALLVGGRFRFPIWGAWTIIIVIFILIWKLAPVDSISRELDSEEKTHCKKVTMKIIVGILIFTGCCTVCRMDEIVSLIALTALVVFISQCMGIVKYGVEKNSIKE